MSINRSLSIGVLLLGVVAVVIGGIFIGQGVSKNKQAEACKHDPLHSERQII